MATISIFRLNREKHKRTSELFDEEILCFETTYDNFLDSFMKNYYGLFVDFDVCNALVLVLATVTFSSYFNHLPREIMSRLPPESLMEGKCLNKSWYSLRYQMSRIRDQAPSPCQSLPCNLTCLSRPLARQSNRG